MKKLVTFGFSLFTLLSTVCVCTFGKDCIESSAIDVVIDGERFSGVRAYKISEEINYFSVREVAVLYRATLEWKPASSQVTAYFSNGKMRIKANKPEVVFGRKSKKMSLPSVLINKNIYIPPEILTSKEFAEITESDVDWDPVSFVLNITPRSDISKISCFTKSESTQVVIQLHKPLSYTVFKSSSSVVVQLLKSKVQRGFKEVNHGAVKDVSYGTQGRAAVVVINLAQSPSLVKAVALQRPDRISLDIKHSKSVDVVGMKETVISLPENYVRVENKDVKDLKNESAKAASKTDAGLVTPLEYGKAQISEITSVIENIADNKDLEKVPVLKFESDNIAEDSITITDDTTTIADIAPKKGNGGGKYKRKRIIVLDAGHGGEDPGAVGPKGTKEKDINLGVVRELKALFDKDSNYEIILTRKNDIFIPLAERANVANEYNADLFISIHCNFNFNRSVNGFEVYFLSEDATDLEAAATATLENSVLEIEGTRLKESAFLKDMLRSMAFNEYLNDSSELSSLIAAASPKRLKIPNRGVKQASFYVLRGTQMPAVLVESAYISNYAQEARFCSRRFRKAVAESVYEGVVKYYARKDKKQR